jgi:hypothetical protein
MNDIFQEVLNEQQEVRRLLWFKRILPIIVGVVCIIVACIFINNFYQNKQSTHNAKIGDELLSIGFNNDKNLDITVLDKIINDSGTRAVELAFLKKIATLVAKQDYNEAKDLLTQVIDDKGSNHFSEVTREYSKLIWLGLVIQDDSAPEGDKAKFEKYANDFHDDKQVFFGLASIIKALWYSRGGNVMEAEKALKFVIDSSNMPEITQMQARALLTTINQEVPITGKVN